MLEDRIKVQCGKRPLENDEDENVLCKVQKQSDGSGRVGVVLSIAISSASADEQADNQDHAGDDSSSASPDEQASNQRHVGDNSDLSSHFHAIGCDNSVRCLIRCSRSDYGTIASLNSEFRSLVRSGDSTPNL